MKKQVKAYHSHDVDVQLSKMNKEAKILSDLIKLLRDVTGDKNIKTIGAFNDWLCKEAGFQSPSFSADSMDLGDAYTQVKYLSDLTPNVAIEDLTPMYTLKAKKIEQIKEEFTTYYTKEEKEVRAKFNKIVAEWETLPHEIKVNSFINRTGNLLSGHIAVK